MTFARGGLYERVRTILRDAGGPVSVDFVVGRLRREAFPCRVRGAIKAMMFRGQLLSSGGEDSAVAGDVDIWLPAHPVSTSSERRRPSPLQKLLLAPLVRHRGARP